MARPLTPRQDRLRALYAALDRIADEINVLLNAELEDGTATSPKPLKPVPCGTERGYQRHRRWGEKCAACREAHRLHERARYELRKHREAS